METLLVGAFLVIFGLISAFAGYGLFRILLPLMGFFAGFSVGFSGVQSLFGANVWSFVASLFTALVVGLLFAALSYFYYTIGVMIVAGAMFAGALAFLGQAIGLSEDGFVMFLLALTGVIIGGILVVRYGLQHLFIVYLTAMFGIGLLLVSAYLLIGDLTVSELHETGILQTIDDTVSKSWLWLFVWLSGTVLAAAVQMAMISQAMFGDRFILEEKNK